MSSHPVVPILSQQLKRDLSSAGAVREHLRRSVLTFDEALVYGRGPEREALLESDDPVECACADNPGMIAEVRAEYPDPDEFAEALEGSRLLVSEDCYPGDTIAEVDTLKRIVGAVAL